MIDSTFSVPHSKILSATRPGGSSSPSTALRGLRSVVTALVALSLGVALVSWLKAGDDAQPSSPSALVTARASSPRAGLSRQASSWTSPRTTQAR